VGCALRGCRPVGRRPGRSARRPGNPKELISAR
jgi:hypothetical protein